MTNGGCTKTGSKTRNKVGVICEHVCVKYL